VAEEVLFIHAVQRYGPIFGWWTFGRFYRRWGGSVAAGAARGRAFDRGYRSTLRGEGVEFADARPYEPGEPWRRIHWALSARRGEPYLWLATEERQITCTIALDLSASMRVYPEKFRQAAIAGAMIALTALKVGDKVQWLGFTNQVVSSPLASSQRKFCLGSLSRAFTFQPTQQRTQLKPLLELYMQTHHRRGLLVLLDRRFLARWSRGFSASTRLSAKALCLDTLHSASS
jgi:uncharacterized protein (DUF58 family)